MACNAAMDSNGIYIYIISEVPFPLSGPHAKRGVVFERRGRLTWTWGIHSTDSCAQCLSIMTLFLEVLNFESIVLWFNEVQLLYSQHVCWFHP